MASFFSSLFNRGAQTNGADNSSIYPKDSFSILQVEQDGVAVVGTVNKAYKNYDKKAEYPWCLHIGMALAPDSVQSNGLPKNDESDIAYQQEDDLVAEIKKLGAAHFVGHIFNEGFLDVYIYLADPKPVHDYLQTQINKDGLLRGFGYEINKDEEWTKAEPLFQ